MAKIEFLLVLVLSYTIAPSSASPFKTTVANHLPAAAADLLYVQLIFRHGDRAPEKFYANSPSIKSWPQGAGQITPLGLQQHYALGAFLRERYGEFLQLNTSGVTFDDVYIRASETERTITSAQTNAASFFAPPSSASNNAMGQSRAWNTTDGSDFGLLWTPVPVHTVAKEKDFYMQEASCERLDKLMDKFEKSDTIQDILHENDVKDLIHQISAVTGEPHKVSQWTLTKKFKTVADTLACERRHNITLPGVDSKFYDDVEQLAQRVFPLPSSDDEIASLQGGCLLGHIADHMEDKLKNISNTDGTYNSRKLVIFSSHDRVVMGALSSAGLHDKVQGTKPPFTATAMFELYTDGTVNILYKDDVSSLDAIRHTQPRLLLSANLDDLLKQWKQTTFTGDDCEKACKK